MDYGRRIYYEKKTGTIIINTGESSSDFPPFTVEEEIALYPQLNARDRDSFDYIEVPFGEHRRDFVECSYYMVNPDTRELFFGYPDTPVEDDQTPSFEEQILQRMGELEQRLLVLEDKLTTS